jgi:hypothetical protein
VGILHAFVTKWLSDVGIATGAEATYEVLPTAKQWTQHAQCSVAAALKSYLDSIGITRTSGFTFQVQNAFGVDAITERKDFAVVGGPPALFISYSWSFDLARMLHLLVLELTASQPGLFSEFAQSDPTFSGRIWVDLLAINQHKDTANDLVRLKDVIKSATHGVVMYLESLVPLSRIWCIYEVRDDAVKGPQQTALPSMLIGRLTLRPWPSSIQPPLPATNSPAFNVDWPPHPRHVTATSICCRRHPAAHSHNFSDIASESPPPPSRFFIPF